MLAAELQQDASDEAASAARRAVLESGLDRARGAEAALEAAEQQHAPRLAAAQEAFFGLSSLAERLRGVHSLATERHRHLAAPPEPSRPGRDPDELDAEAADPARGGGRAAPAAGRRAGPARRRRGRADRGRDRPDRDRARLAAESRAAAQRAERLARLRSQVGAARSKLTAAQEEAARLAAAHEQARARAERAQHEYGQLAGRGVRPGTGPRRPGRRARARHRRAGPGQRQGDASCATAEHEAERRPGRAAGAHRGAAGGGPPRRRRLRRAARRAGPVRRRAGLRGRAAQRAGRRGRRHRRRAGRGRGRGGRVRPRRGRDHHRRAEERGRRAGGTGDRGRPAVATAAGRPGPHGRSQRGAARAHRRYAALDLVKAPGRAGRRVEELLARGAGHRDLAQGLDLVRADPGLRVVTRDGDLLGAHWAHGGSAGAPSVLGLRAAGEQAAGQLGEAERRCQRAERELADAGEDEDAARQVLAEALARLREADAAAAETSGRAGHAGRRGQGRAGRGRAPGRRDRDGRAGPGEGPGPARGPAGQADRPGGGEHGRVRRGHRGRRRGPGDKNALAAQATAARNAEMEARLDVRTVEERLRAVAGRGDALASAAAAERQAIAAGQGPDHTAGSGGARWPARSPTAPWPR